MSRSKEDSSIVDVCRNVDLPCGLSKVFCLCFVSDLACCLMVGREVAVAGTYVENVLSVFCQWFDESCPSAERAFHLVAARGLNKSVAALSVSY